MKTFRYMGFGSSNYIIGPPFRLPYVFITSKTSEFVDLGLNACDGARLDTNCNAPKSRHPAGKALSQTCLMTIIVISSIASLIWTDIGASAGFK